jgi:hypothetical protein
VNSAVHDASQPQLSGSCDVVTILEALPDMNHPVEALRTARNMPAEGGSVLAAMSAWRTFQFNGPGRLRFHDLRHTFGTQAIASGAHVMDVKEWMGHRHLSTTMRYVHHQPRHEAAERLGRHFTGAASELDALIGEPGDVHIGPPPRTLLTTTPDDPKRHRNARVRGISGVFPARPHL